MVEVRRDVWGQQTGGPDAFTERGAGGTWGSASVVSRDHCKVSAAAHVAAMPAWASASSPETRTSSAPLICGDKGKSKVLSLGAWPSQNHGQHCSLGILAAARAQLEKESQNRKSGENSLQALGTGCLRDQDCLLGRMVAGV
ncbi:unnamed protein product [Rangifer tarandus platyrhynchus]|uniref:Uncharacterized protein n=1 Tax=Rangifer tarandus platyrhynchus TaxID=3082113 RepID=A0AC59ZQ31_RANTA